MSSYPPVSKLNMKTYIYHGLETSQYLCYWRPDERKVVQNPGFPNQDVEELLVDFNKLKVKKLVESGQECWKGHYVLW
jgi:hypothetical protein